jgi:outer membrane protein assembly factor BamB
MSHRHFVVAFVTLVVAMLNVGRAGAENWPQWRGPQLNGVSGETGLPTKWSATKNVAWRLPLPGPAGATPVVWGDHIFLTSVDGPDLVLIAADTSGKQLWKRVMGTGNRAVRDEGNSASPSPCTDGEHVWAMMSTGILACYDLAGNETWKVDLQERYGRFRLQYVMSSSPVLDKDRLYLQLIHSGGAGVFSLDKATGREIWQQRRPSDAHDECEHSYASPIIYRDDKQALLISHEADYVIAHRLSDGVEVWRCGGLNPKGRYNNTLRLVASPAAVPGLIVVPSAKNGPVLGLRPDRQGDITTDAADHVWTRPQNTPDVPSPVVHDGLVYLCRENGNLIVLDATTGEQYYEHRTHSDRHRASPVYADGKLYLTARDGTVTVVKAGKEFELLATNKLDQDISASPAISGGSIYLRTFAALYAIREAR